MLQEKNLRGEIAGSQVFSLNTAFWKIKVEVESWKMTPGDGIQLLSNLLPLSVSWTYQFASREQNMGSSDGISLPTLSYKKSVASVLGILSLSLLDCLWEERQIAMLSSAAWRHPWRCPQFLRTCKEVTHANNQMRALRSRSLNFRWIFPLGWQPYCRLTRDLQLEAELGFLTHGNCEIRNFVALSC